MVDLFYASSMSELYTFRSLPSRAIQYKYSFGGCSAPSRLPSLYASGENRRRIVSCCSVSYPGNDREDLFRASILLSETLSHYRMRNSKYAEENEEVGDHLDYGRRTSSFPVESKPSKSTSLVIELLKRFKNPTIFLKVSCDKDFLLPIIVEEDPLTKLVQQLSGKDNEGNLDQYHLVQNIAAKMGYKATLLMIKKQATTTYSARLYFTNGGKGEVFSVEMEPCDGLIIANLFEIPICAQKRMVYVEGIVYSSAMGRFRESKASYDVNMDRFSLRFGRCFWSYFVCCSAGEGQNYLAEELNLVRNMNIAVEEERYKDAALWRTRLMQFLKSSPL